MPRKSYRIPQAEAHPRPRAKVKLGRGSQLQQMRAATGKSTRQDPAVTEYERLLDGGSPRKQPLPSGSTRRDLEREEFDRALANLKRCGVPIERLEAATREG